MSQAPEHSNGDQLELLVRARTAQLVRGNEALREEVRQLRERNAELITQCQASLSGRQVDRDIRRAALNLMEDAVEARRQAHEEIVERRRVEAELREGDRRKDEFLATLAHELRTPLAPLRNSLHILRMGGAEGGSAERVVGMMERQVIHMVRLVDDLMEVSRITRGVIELRKERVELAAVVRSAVEITKPLIDGAGHQLAISIPHEPVYLDADPVRLSQVLANILNNAAKYTEQGGQIWLSAAREGADVAVTIRDNGIGIPADMLTKIFDLFTQIDRAYNRTQGGLGIGLTLARSLVKLHGGSIDVMSEGQGRGSQFVVRLPLAIDRPFRSPGPRQVRPVVIGPQRILVVDDNRDAAESLTMLLRFMGAEVHTVNDGRAALEALRTFRPKIVLLDIGMPLMDGYQVARRTREQPEFRDLTLIALTGWSQEEDRRRSIEAGFDYHLTKPVQLDVLQDILASLEDQRQEVGTGCKA